MKSNKLSIITNFKKLNVNKKSKKVEKRDDAL